MLRRFARPSSQSVCLQCSFRLFRKEARRLGRPHQARFFASDDGTSDGSLTPDAVVEDLFSRATATGEPKASGTNYMQKKRVRSLYPPERRLPGFGTDLPPLEDDSLLGPDGPRQGDIAWRTPDFIQQRNLVEGRQGGFVDHAALSQLNPPVLRTLPGFGNKRFAGNRVLQEGSRELGTAMLGKPARAIIMRDGGLYVRKPSTTQIDPEPEAESVDISEVLENQADEPTSDDVRENISSLRPTSERHLAQRDFLKLQTALLDGFTAPQLKDYLQWSTKQPDLALSTEAMATRLPWVHKMTPWVPVELALDAAGSEEVHLAGYITTTSSPKERVAVRILREAWGLSIHELTIGLGEVQVKVKKEEFVLLMRGTQRFMNRLARTWLDAGETMESLPEERTIRFVVRKPKADVVVAQLDKLLSRVRTKTIPLRMVGAENISEVVLEEVGKMTNTNIRKSATGQKIHVDWLEVRADHIDEPVEDLCHVVFRLLLTAFKPATTIRSLASNVDDRTEGRLITDQVNKAKWAWKDRLLEWQRFILPSPSNDGAPVDPAQRVTLRKLPHKIQTASKRNADKPSVATTQQSFFQSLCTDTSSRTPAQWADTLQHSTVAHYGYILHQAADNVNKSEPMMLPVSNLKDLDIPRIFSPVVPHPSRVAELEAQAYEATSSETNETTPTTQIYPAESTILMRFQASPIMGGPDFSSSVQAYPTLELRLAADDTDVLSVQSLRAIKDRVLSDVMMPNNAVDMRFSQTKYLELLPDSNGLLTTYPPINTFLINSRINLGRGKIETPDQQEFQLPKWLVGGSEDNVPKQERPKLDNISYDFVGLELHRAVSMGYKGFKMTYTSIEAGQGGGRRAELSVEAERFGSSPAAPVASGKAFEVPSIASPVGEVKETESLGSEELEIDEEADKTDPDAEKVTQIEGSQDEASEVSLSKGAARKLQEKEFLDVCYDLARNNGLWEGYSGDMKR